jgi:hypothetical protein
MGLEGDEQRGSGRGLLGVLGSRRGKLELVRSRPAKFVRLSA